MRMFWFALVLATCVAACSDDAVDPCPTGSCTLPGNTVVKYKFNNYPAVGFDSDTCSELGVAKVQVELVGVDDPEEYDVLVVQCPEGQATFSGLPVQNYTVAVTALDANDVPLTKSALPGRGTIAAAGPGARVETTVNVQYESWANSYTGQFLYKLTWAGVTCNPAATDMTITQQTLTLTVNGTVVTQMNNRGDKLDGSTDYECWPSTMPPQTVAMVPWGPATLKVVGKNDADTVLFDHTFDTFVGAGMFNPTLTFDSPAL